MKLYFSTTGIRNFMKIQGKKPCKLHFKFNQSGWK